MVEQGHCFALHVMSELRGVVGQTIILSDPDLVHRICHVLRLSVGESLVLFDAAVFMHGRIVMLGKKVVHVTIDQMERHTVLLPEIHWFLPILEKDSFEEALSHATVMGITSITPVITEQSARQIRVAHERQIRIMAAAAEQSKQFVFPQIRPIVSFGEALALCAQAPTVLFDEDGQSTRVVLDSLVAMNLGSLHVVSGPEGGLTAQEVAAFRNQGALVCSLTPTILRAWVAVSVGAALLRSCLR